MCLKCLECWKDAVYYVIGLFLYSILFSSNCHVFVSNWYEILRSLFCSVVHLH